MATVLVYTSPARGHLYPILGVALELRARGHDVHVRTLAPEVALVRSLGLPAEAIVAAVEARELDDWRAKSPMQALELAMKTFGERSAPEVEDVQGAIKATRAQALLVDTNSWGAQAAAEASGLPWAMFQPYFTALPAVGVPPFGPGLARSANLFGRVRDAALRKIIFGKMDQVALPAINRARSRVGLKPFDSITALPLNPPLVLYFTAVALEYPRAQWPANYRFVGPGLWEPPSEAPEWLAAVERPLALVTCSTERQSDRPLIEAALQGLPAQGLFVVATSAAYAPDEIEAVAGPHSRLEQFLPHGPIIKRASVVVCHGGMGITQRALASGAPVVVVPFGRDQNEVARRVEFAGAGVRLLPKQLNAASLAAAVKAALALRPGAQRIAEAFANTGGEKTAASAFEQLLREAERANRRPA